MHELGVIILAAGQGIRMKSEIPKVLHRLGGKALFLHALETARRLDPRIIAMVVGHGAATVREAYGAIGVVWVTQERQLGTGHAVLCANEAFKDFGGEVLILSGDVPLIREQTLQAMLEHHRSRRAALTLLTAKLDIPQG